MRTGNERKSSASSSPVDCDVVLGLKTSESYTCDLGGGSLFNRVAGDVMYRNNTLFFPQNRASPSGVFTESQWQELERQNLINRYIVASIPVPPQLLFLPHLLPSSFSQCNSNSLSPDLKFGSSDPEPWRCKRTDGKKWRCSRDVAPDQKYCERHAHKTKPRSRKEISSSQNHHHPLPSSSRPADWFVRGAKPQVMMQTPPPPPPSKDHHTMTYHHNKNNPPSAYTDEQGFYIPDTSTLHHHQMDSPQTTRHFFIDAWEKDAGFDMGISSKIKKLSPSSSSSLSLSMSGYNVGVAGYDQDDDGGHLGIGMMSSASTSWMNSISSPGGPLGEALCLAGNATSTRAGSNLASPYSSKSSCEDGSHALNFIAQ